MTRGEALVKWVLFECHYVINVIDKIIIIIIIIIIMGKLKIFLMI